MSDTNDNIPMNPYYERTNKTVLRFSLESFLRALKTVEENADIPDGLPKDVYVTLNNQHIEMTWECGPDWSKPPF